MISDRNKPTCNCPEGYVQMYYECQFERMGRLEDQRLMISNIVITISVLAFSFGFGESSGLTIINGLGLPMLMIFANLFAIAYIVRAVKSILAHRSRAEQVLQTYAPELQTMNDATPWIRSGIFGSRTDIQRRLHYLLSLIALIPILLFFQVIRW